MTPNEHAWHHSNKIRSNYGANFNIFDKLHKTYYRNFIRPDQLGLNINMSFWKKALFPF
jgi:sterol desaturase/sphingolipid hydroxylase (fatty acid hydroxylase superfamily)